MLWYCIWYSFSWSNGKWCKHFAIFWSDNSSSVHTDNTKKDILTLGEAQTDGLDDAIIPAEDKYPINFTNTYYGITSIVYA